MLKNLYFTCSVVRFACVFWTCARFKLLGNSFEVDSDNWVRQVNGKWPYGFMPPYGWGSCRQILLRTVPWRLRKKDGSGSRCWWIVVNSISSIYVVYTYIYHKDQPKVGKYAIHGSLWDICPRTFKNWLVVEMIENIYWGLHTWLITSRKWSRSRNRLPQSLPVNCDPCWFQEIILYYTCFFLCSTELRSRNVEITGIPV